MEHFIKGLELSGLYYQECVMPVLDRYYPHLKYTAALLGGGSEILGYDTPLSTDHDWGPRLMIFLSEGDVPLQSAISDTLRNTLPHMFYGYSTRRDASVDQPWIDYTTVKSFFEGYLGINPYDEITAVGWLTLQEHALLGVTKGQVFHDGLGELEPIRKKFSYYPKDVWLYLMASQWARISEERAFMGRCGDAGDELGSHLIASRLVRDLMRLCYLIEKQYAPYNKWFGTGFSQLKCAEELYPLFMKVMNGSHWKGREQYLSQAYTIIGKMHNELGITRPLNTKVSYYYTRPYLVIDSDVYVEAILEVIEDEEVKNIEFPIGSVNQFADSTHILCNSKLCKRLQSIIKGSGLTN